MKKTLSIILSVVIIFLIGMPVNAAMETNNITVVADPFDNTIYDEYKKVTITSESIDFTEIEDSLAINLSGTTSESIKNIVVVDNGTIEFELLTYNVNEGFYNLVMSYKDGGIPIQQWVTQAIMVKEGHFVFDNQPLTVADILTNGITIKFNNVEIESDITVMLDDVKTDCTKVSGRVFKLYPTEEQIVNKENIEVRIIVQNGYYKGVLRIIDNDIYLDKELYSREQSLSFYINSKVIEFPLEKEDISVVITGRGRYIDISDIVVYNKYRVKADTLLPLAIGTYNIAISWDDSVETYNMEFEVVNQNVKYDNDLNESVLDFLEVDGESIQLTLFEDQILRYIDSEVKHIDLTSYEFNSFVLDLRNEGLLLLLSENLGLTINFSDYQFVIPKESLQLINTKDAYIVAEKTDTFPAIDGKYHIVSDNLYVDSNLIGMKIFTSMKQNIKNYSKIAVFVQNSDLNMNIEDAFLVVDRIYCNYQYTGTYKFVVEANTFNDIYNGYWGLEYISSLTTVGIIDGMGDGTFLPETNITRAQFAKLVSVSIDLPVGDGLSYFQDIYTNTWYYKYIVTLEKANIVEGDFFNPDNTILRKDMAVMVMKAYEYNTGEDLQLLANNSTSKFTDLNDLTEEEINCILAAQYLGIINGMTETQYAPNDTATRAQAATIIYRFMKIQDLL